MNILYLFEMGGYFVIISNTGKKICETLGSLYSNIS